MYNSYSVREKAFGFLILLLVLAPPAQAQDLVWARQLGGVFDDRAFAVALDSSGNVYTVGQFIGTADFDPGPDTFNLTSVGSLDGFISKLDSDGNFVWARGAVVSLRAVVLDGSGNVYIVGRSGDISKLDGRLGRDTSAGVGTD